MLFWYWPTEIQAAMRQSKYVFTRVFFLVHSAGVKKQKAKSEKYLQLGRHQKQIKKKKERNYRCYLLTPFEQLCQLKGLCERKFMTI